MVQDNCYITRSPIREVIECEKYAKIVNIGQSWVQLLEMNLESLNGIRLKSWKIKAKGYSLSSKISHLPLSVTAQTS